MNITFQPLQKEHLSILVDWLSQPHVQRWYHVEDGSPFSYEAMKKKMLPRIEGKEAIFCFIILYENKQIGYIQWYDAKQFPREGYQLEELDKKLNKISKLAAIDLYIGEISVVGKGIGTQVIKQFIQEVLVPRGFTACYADPEVLNQASVNAFKKAGFKPLQPINTEGIELLPMLIEFIQSEGK